MIDVTKNDIEYMSIVGHILDNDEFNKIKKIEHHGVSRFEHSLKVSYFSYKIAKILRLNYNEVAKGGLLHDFFLSADERKMKERFLSTFNHPKKAVSKSNEVFGITDLEKDIIKSHMFPVNMSLPKYAESWVVNLTDKIVGTYEFGMKFGYKLAYITNLYILFLFNSIK